MVDGWDTITYLDYIVSVWGNAIKLDNGWRFVGFCWEEKVFDRLTQLDHFKHLAGIRNRINYHPAPAYFCVRIAPWHNTRVLPLVVTESERERDT